MLSINKGIKLDYPIYLDNDRERLKNLCILENKKNIYSQNGEDGIIQYIFTKLNIYNGNFIEFGAWDGKHLSNTYNLFLSGWGGIYIEADSRKYIDLVKNFGKYDNVTCINSLVGYSDSDNLDILIDGSGHKKLSFDFVSIDVDGFDYFILEKMEKYLPKVICIEINAGHSPNYNKLIPESVAANNIGQSMYIIVNEAKRKGYFPLCYTGNLFLVKNEYKNIFKDDIKSLEGMYIDFLNYLDRTNPGGVIHLYRTFVINGVYNNFRFENRILEKFCKKYLKKIGTKINKFFYNDIKIIIKKF